MRRTLRTIACLGLTTLLAACGGSKSEAKEPESSEAEAPSSAKADDSAPKKDSSGEDKGESKSRDDKKSDKADKSGKSQKAEPEEKKSAGRSAKDVLTRPDVLFMFSFNASEPHQVAEKKCTEKSGDDPKKRADCMTKAGKEFDSDGMAFLQVDGKWWWLKLRRTGGRLVALHKVEIDFGDDGEKEITIKPHGPDKGSKPGGLPSKLTIEVPSESEIDVVDPKFGRMVYEAKLGMMGKDERQ